MGSTTGLTVSGCRHRPPSVSLETPPNGGEVCCAVDDVCIVAATGEFRPSLPRAHVVYVAVKPLVTPAVGYFVQQTPATTAGLTWSSAAQLGSAEFPLQEGGRFELRAIIVDVSDGDAPIGPFMNIEAVPGFVVASDSTTIAITLVCEATVMSRLFRFLDDRQNDTTGFLPSFDLHDDLPDDFKAFLVDNPGFLYDNALAALAYFARRGDADVERAGRILDGMLAVQKDTGAFPDAINAVTGQDIPTPDFGTGNQMWAVLALLKGYDFWQTTDPDRAADYLVATEAAAEFVRNQANSEGCGGFVLFPGSTLVSTEHNTDAYAAFSRLADVLAARGDEAAAERFRSAAADARIFVECMFDPATGRSWTGTTNLGLSINTFPVPEDTQTWPLLSLGGAKWTRSLEWLLANLWVTAGSCPTLDGVNVCGPPSSDADTSEVWFEGLAHVWVAAAAADMLGDPRLQECAPEVVLAAVQSAAPHTDGLGIVAACGTLDTGFNFSYFNTPAVAPTAWAILGFRGVNPFWDVPTEGGLSGHPRADAPWVEIDVPPDSQYSCETGDPCVFEVSGRSAGVAGAESLAIRVVINPTDPSAGARFVQASPASVDEQGAWTAAAQLGSQEFPAGNGDRFEVSVIIVDSSAGAVPPAIHSITRAEIPALVATSGILAATAQVAP
ncbi:MAG: hypothetical protein HY763_10595 [Planctomycetes bacterium]|nr:hypothetical protein [Planctomycetota bacterium]